MIRFDVRGWDGAEERGLGTGVEVPIPCWIEDWSRDLDEDALRDRYERAVTRARRVAGWIDLALRVELVVAVVAVVVVLFLVHGGGF